MRPGENAGERAAVRAPDEAPKPVLPFPLAAEPAEVIPSAPRFVDDGNWILDVSVLEAWERGRTRRRVVKAIGWVLVALFAALCVAIGRDPSARHAMATWVLIERA